MLASAEGASGENLEHSTQSLRKSAFCITGLGKSAQSTEYCENALESLVDEYVDFAHASRTRRKRCSRAPKARAEKFNRSFLREFYAKVPCITGLCKNVLKTRSIVRMPKVTRSRVRGFCTRLQNKEKTMLASAKGASGKIWRILREFYAELPFAPLCLAESAQNMLQSHSFTNAWVLRASTTRRKRCSRAPKARAEKIWRMLREFYAKSAFCTTVLGKKCSKHGVFESAPKSLVYECVGFARASRTKRKRCSRAPKARAEKNWDISSNFGKENNIL